MTPYFDIDTPIADGFGSKEKLAFFSLLLLGLAQSMMHIVFLQTTFCYTRSCFLVIYSFII
ncbi:MAG: hypothetical protein IJT59_03340, partial [Desulfovibrionaceae bacterium]|nr:hypothetical protein [Desulfovibrionaceae bacterium]